MNVPLVPSSVDEVGDAAFGLRDDLGAGGFEVRLPVGVVVVLIRVEVAVRIGVVDFADLADRAVRTLVGGRQHEFGAVGFQDALALDRGVDRQAELHLVAARRADHGVGDAGVAAGGVDQGLVAGQLAGTLAVQNHVERRAGP